MQRIPELILRAGNQLFWDVEPSQLDPEKHEDFIIGRVLTEGTEDLVRALRSAVGDAALRNFLTRAPHFDDAEREPELLMLVHTDWSDVRAYFEREVKMWWGDARPE